MIRIHANSWEVTDEFWDRLEKLVPERVRDPHKKYLCSAGAGRPPKPARLVFEAIVCVLRTGFQSLGRCPLRKIDLPSTLFTDKSLVFKWVERQLGVDEFGNRQVAIDHHAHRMVFCGRATASAPMLPPASTFFSTITG